MKTLSVEGERPMLEYAWVNAVKEDIKRMFNSRENVGMLQDLRPSDVEFMLSMGLLVQDVSDRFKVLKQCLVYAYIYGGPHKMRNRREREASNAQMAQDHGAAARAQDRGGFAEASGHHQGSARRDRLHGRRP